MSFLKYRNAGFKCHQKISVARCRNIRSVLPSNSFTYSIPSLPPLDDMKRTKSYSGDTKRAAVRAYKYVQTRSTGPTHVTPTPVGIAVAASGGASTRSVYRWLDQDLSQDAIDERLSHRGRKPLLSDSQECLTIGYVIDCRRSLLTVSRRDVVDFARAYLKLELRPQFISDLFTRYDFSLQKVLTRSSRMVSHEVVDDALTTIATIREYGFPPDRILVMDETGLWSNVSSPRTYHFRNWSNISIFSNLIIFSEPSLPMSCYRFCHSTSSLRFLTFLGGMRWWRIEATATETPSS